MIVNNDISIKNKFDDREELFVFMAGVLRGWSIAVKMKPRTDCYSEECCVAASAITNARVINVGIDTAAMYFEIIVADRGQTETHIRIAERQLQVNKGKTYPSHMVVEAEDSGERGKQMYYQAPVFEIADEITGISFDDVVQWEDDVNAEKMAIEILRQPQGQDGFL